MLVRDAVKFYRYFNKQYNEIKAALLLPEDPPLVLDEQDYEKPYTGEYIDSPDLVVIKDFKRVVSYSSEPRDFEAYEAKRQRELASQADKSSPIDQLADVFSKLELKKFLFYGTIYEDPLTKGAGNGAWVEKDGAKLRLISAWATVNGQREIRGALHFSLSPGESLALLGKIVRSCLLREKTWPGRKRLCLCRGVLFWAVKSIQACPEILPCRWSLS